MQGKWSQFDPIISTGGFIFMPNTVCGRILGKLRFHFINNPAFIGFCCQFHYPISITVMHCIVTQTMGFVIFWLGPGFRTIEYVTPLLDNSKQNAPVRQFYCWKKRKLWITRSLANNNSKPRNYLCSFTEANNGQLQTPLSIGCCVSWDKMKNMFFSILQYVVLIWWVLWLKLGCYVPLFYYKAKKNICFFFVVQSIFTWLLFKYRFSCKSISSIIFSFSYSTVNFSCRFSPEKAFTFLYCAEPYPNIWFRYTAQIPPTKNC